MVPWNHVLGLTTFLLVLSETVLTGAAAGLATLIHCLEASTAGSQTLGARQPWLADVALRQARVQSDPNRPNLRTTPGEALEFHAVLIFQGFCDAKYRGNKDFHFCKQLKSY